MKFYIIEISEGDAKIKGKSIYEYETQREAVASFHKKLGTAMSSDLYTSELLMAISEKGAIILKDRYDASVEIETEA